MAQTTKQLIKVRGLYDNGNAFAILGKAHRAARKAGWTDEEWERFATEAKSDDFDHLLQTVMKHFEELTEDDDGDDE